jgi:hypothetical protein
VNIPEIPEGKFDYFFGRATGRQHNLARTNQNAFQMKRIGVPDSQIRQKGMLCCETIWSRQLITPAMFCMRLKIRMAFSRYVNLYFRDRLVNLRSFRQLGM